MNTKLKETLCRTKIEADTTLPGQIWQKIITRNKKISLLKIWSFSILAFLSLLGMIPAFIKLTEDFSKSGFYEYLSLLFSSNGNLALYWKELSYSLAESLPVVGIIYALLLVFVLIYESSAEVRVFVNFTSVVF